MTLDKNSNSAASILIVDDHHLIRRTLLDWLSEKFPSKMIIEAGSGEEALDQFAAISPDIVLMDIHLPGINGIETIQIIKQKYPGTKIIVLTVQEDKRYRFKAEEAGADAYVIKRDMYSKLIPLIVSFNGNKPHLEGDQE